MKRASGPIHEMGQLSNRWPSVQGCFMAPASVIVGLQASETMLVDSRASRCPPCLAMNPPYRSISQEKNASEPGWETCRLAQRDTFGA
jgi:hypothetical protein